MVSAVTEYVFGSELSLGNTSCYKKKCSQTFYDCLSRNNRLIKWFLHAQEVRLYCMECTFAKRAFEPGYNSPKMRMLFA